MDFKNLIVYQKALNVVSALDENVLANNDLDRSIKDQLRRASNSIVLNIAEGSSRLSRADRKNFYVIARGSALECKAALEIIFRTKKLQYPEIESTLDEVSKMLFKMISNLHDTAEQKQ